MATFFTADTHFGDAHILRQREDAFVSIEEHDADLIRRWNEVVTIDDEVWHLGDFAAGASRARCAEIFAALNGRKRLIRGNHDTNRVLDLPWIKPPSESTRITRRDAAGTEWRLFLAHYAHRAWPGLWRGTRHLYGHTHGSLPDTRFSCDVGVDVWDYRPARLDDLIARQNVSSIVPEELQRGSDPGAQNVRIDKGVHQQASASAPERASLSLMITQRQRMKLRELGFTDASIRLMTPAEAHQQLGVNDLA